MVIKYIVLVLVSLGGGVLVGGAIAAFLTILEIIPRLAQLTETPKKIKLYEATMIISFVLSIIVYFMDYTFAFPRQLVVPIGLIYGVFIGLLSSALAEVLNVIPVISKKIKIKNQLKYVIWSLVGGKVAGSLIYWLWLN